VKKVRQVTIYSRNGCHLCEVAHQTLQGLQSQSVFEITEILIDGQPDLIELYGEQVPVIHIDGKPHDYFKVDPTRFLLAINQR
jgi:glutaredoxin